MTKPMGLETTPTMEGSISTQAIGKMTCTTVRVRKSSAILQYMKVLSERVRKMGTVSILGLMAPVTKACGKITK